jgi:hypothetical protein
MSRVLSYLHGSPWAITEDAMRHDHGDRGSGVRARRSSPRQSARTRGPRSRGTAYLRTIRWTSGSCGSNGPCSDTRISSPRSPAPPPPSSWRRTSGRPSETRASGPSSSRSIPRVARSTAWTSSRSWCTRSRREAHRCAHLRGRGVRRLLAGLRRLRGGGDHRVPGREHRRDPDAPGLLGEGRDRGMRSYEFVSSVSPHKAPDPKPRKAETRSRRWWMTWGWSSWRPSPAPGHLPGGSALGAVRGRCRARGPRAVEAGLADRMATLEELLDELEDDAPTGARNHHRPRKGRISPGGNDGRGRPSRPRRPSPGPTSAT